MDISFAVVIPMFNEAENAENCANEIIGALKKFDCLTAIIFVNDGSTDNTENILKNLINQHKNIFLVSHISNSGYGSALRTGSFLCFKQGIDYLVYMDSDLTNDPKDLSLFYNKMLEGFDYIKATRYSGGGGVVGVPFKRRFISQIGNKIARALFKNSLTDPTNGFRAMRTRVAVNLNLTENGFPLIMEELYQLKNMKIKYANVPVILTSREIYLRNSSFSYTPRLIYKYLKYPVLSYINNNFLNRWPPY